MTTPKPTPRKGESDFAYLDRVKAWRAANKKADGGAENKKGRQPLGVHNGYVAPGQKFTRGGFDPRNERHVTKGKDKTKGTPPKYFDGAVTEIFGSMSPTDRFRLQGDLKRLGLIKKVNGQFDGPMKEAMGRILGASNASGTTWEKYLNKQLRVLDEAGVQNVDDLYGDGSGDRDPLNVVLTNPTSIKGDLETTGRDLIGSSVGGINQDQFVSSFQAEERRAQEQNYANDASGGTTVKAPDVASKIIAENPNEFKTEQLVGKHYSDILNALTGQESQGLGA